MSKIFIFPRQTFCVTPKLLDPWIHSVECHDGTERKVNDWKETRSCSYLLNLQSTELHWTPFSQKETSSLCTFPAILEIVSPAVEDDASQHFHQKPQFATGTICFFSLPARFLLFIETECGWFPPPTPLPKSPGSLKPLKREVFITELLTTLPLRSSPWWLCSRATEASQTRSTRPNGLKQLASPSQREANYTLSIAARMTHTEISKACNFKGLIKLHELLTSSCTWRHWRPELCSSRLSAADTTLRKYTHTHDAPLKSVNGCKLPTALSFFLPGLFFFKALRH